MKIFLCSTSFDLEDLRALAVNRFGDKHEFIHFEDAAFPSRRGLHSHDQCIEAVKQADVVVCIIDRRYGGHYRGTNGEAFPEQSVVFKGRVGTERQTVEVKIATRDLSISWCELLTAFQEQKYVITFARKRTLDEKATRRENQGVADFKPAHVDDVRVFDLLDWITKQPRDNWIIPFDNAVDFLEKLEKWLDVADAQLLPPAAPTSRTHQPITVVVEGPTDAEIVKAIASQLGLSRPLSLIIARGKRALLGNLRTYAQAFENSAGIVVLADSDTTSDREIEEQRATFESIISDSARPDTQLVFAVPEIESWFENSDGNLANNRRRFRVTAGDIFQLQRNLEARARAVPSLNQFIATIRELDSRERPIAEPQPQ